MARLILTWNLSMNLRLVIVLLLALVLGAKQSLRFMVPMARLILTWNHSMNCLVRFPQIELRWRRALSRNLSGLSGS